MGEGEKRRVGKNLKGEKSLRERRRGPAMRKGRRRTSGKFLAEGQKKVSRFLPTGGVTPKGVEVQLRELGDIGMIEEERSGRAPKPLVRDFLCGRKKKQEERVGFGKGGDEGRERVMHHEHARRSWS